MTQEQVVLQRVKVIGYVDNFWAIENYILRLGAIICQLKKQGLKFEGHYGKEIGKEKRLWKNYYYIHKPEVGQLKLL